MYLLITVVYVVVNRNLEVFNLSFVLLILLK